MREQALRDKSYFANVAAWPKVICEDASRRRRDEQ